MFGFFLGLTTTLPGSRRQAHLYDDGAARSIAWNCSNGDRPPSAEDPSVRTAGDPDDQIDPADGRPGGWIGKLSDMHGAGLKVFEATGVLEI